MGLSNAPAVFQSVLNRLFAKDLSKNGCVYLDDILLFSETENDHYTHLARVLDCLWRSGLKSRNVQV
jgi:hypothetical protein